MGEGGFLKNKKFWLGTNILLVLSSFILAIYVYRLIFFYSSAVDIKVKDKISEIKDIIPQNDCPNCLGRMIDGVNVAVGKENIFPAAVIIENHIESRPVAGLSKANLVIETEAEGGITRYLAIFADGEKIERIGPVRSARSYFVDWAKEFSAVFAHVGGSPDALAMIIKENLFDLNEYYNEKSFWRDNNRAAPHNVYTSSEKLQGFMTKRDLSAGKFLSWKFKEEKILEERPLSGNISIGYKPGYQVGWEYNRLNNVYARALDGQAHQDEKGRRIIAKNVVIAVMAAKVVDSELRLKMQNIGTGQAAVCRDGICQKGRWKKTAISSRMRFYNENDEEIEFNMGTTWVEVVRPELEVVF
jgi:hypothetical protein